MRSKSHTSTRRSPTFDGTRLTGLNLGRTCPCAFVCGSSFASSHMNRLSAPPLHDLSRDKKMSSGHLVVPGLCDQGLNPLCRHFWTKNPEPLRHLSVPARARQLVSAELLSDVVLALGVTAHATAPTKPEFDALRAVQRAPPQRLTGTLRVGDSRFRLIAVFSIILRRCRASGAGGCPGATGATGGGCEGIRPRS